MSKKEVVEGSEEDEGGGGGLFFLFLGMFTYDVLGEFGEGVLQRQASRPSTG